MSWIDFLFGALAGASCVFALCAWCSYRLLRPYLKAASQLSAKKQATWADAEKAMRNRN